MLERHICRLLVGTVCMYGALALWIYATPQVKQLVADEIWQLADLITLISLNSAIVLIMVYYHFKVVPNLKISFFMSIFLFWSGAVFFINFLLVGHWRAFLIEYRNGELSQPVFSWMVLSAISIGSLLFLLIPPVSNTLQYSYAHRRAHK